MILDDMHGTLADYGTISPKIARAIEWVKHMNPSDLEPEKMISLDGNRINAKIQVYRTIEPDETLFEAHRLFIDIQMIVSGHETIYWAPLSRLSGVHTPYDYDNDVVFFRDPLASVPISMEAGDFVIFFPSDGHKPKCLAEHAEDVEKIVVKIAV